MTEMFADSEEGFQRDDLQFDNSSSSGSESQKHETAPKELFSTLPELNIYDEQATTSSAIAVPSSSNLDVRNEENLQVLQSPGSQDQTSSHVQITGGEFVGAHFGPQTSHQHQNIKVEKLEQSQHVHHHHHHHYYPSEQGTFSNEPFGATGYKSDKQQEDVAEEPSTSSGGRRSKIRKKRGRCSKERELLLNGERVRPVEEGQQRFIGDQVIGGCPGVGARFCDWIVRYKKQICLIFIVVVTIFVVSPFLAVVIANELQNYETTLPPITTSKLIKVHYLKVDRSCPAC